MDMFVLCLGMRRSGSTLQYNLIRKCLSTHYDMEVHGTCNEPALSNLIRNSDTADASTNDRIHLIKSHSIDTETVKEHGERIAIYVTYRDLRDVYLSLKEKVNMPLNDYIAQCKDWLADYEELCELAQVRSYCYEEMYAEPRAALDSIQADFSLCLDEDKIEQIIHETSVTSALNVTHRFTWKDRILHRCNKVVYMLPRKLRKAAMRIQAIRYIRHKVLRSNLEDSETLLHIDHISRFRGVPGSWRKALDPVESETISRTFGAWLERHGYQLR